MPFYLFLSVLFKAFNALLISGCKAFWPNSSFLLGLGVLPFLPFRVLVYKLSYDVIFGDLNLKLKLRELFSLLFFENFLNLSDFSVAFILDLSIKFFILDCGVLIIPRFTSLYRCWVAVSIRKPEHRTVLDIKPTRIVSN